MPVKSCYYTILIDVPALAHSSCDNGFPWDCEILNRFFFFLTFAFYFSDMYKGLFVYLFLAVLGLCCCVWACGEWGPLCCRAPASLIAVASLVACGARAQ